MNKKPVTLAIAGTLALAGAGFTVNALAGGYMHDHGTASDGKAAEGKCGIGKMDTDKDGKVSKSEFAAAHDGSDEKFASHDPNGDGFIDAAEMKAHHAAKGADKSKMEGKCGEGKCGGSA